jgi:hypothetical protein
MKRKILFTVVAILMVALPLVAAAEIYCRLYAQAGYITPAILKDRSLQYTPSPLSKPIFPARALEAKGWKPAVYKINSLGYRGREFSPDKPGETIRIMIYGGSAVFDLAAGEGQHWPALVEQELHQQGFTNVEVINAGIPNHASWDAVGRVLGEGHRFDPDYLLLYAAWNDIKYFRSDASLLRDYAIGDVPFNPHLDYYNGLDQWLCETLQTYVRLRSRVLELNFQTGTEGAVPRDEPAGVLTQKALDQYRLNAAVFADLALNIGARPVLMTQARLPTAESSPEQRERIGYRWVGLNHETLVQAYAATDEALRQVAAEKGVDLIDASAEMSGKDANFRDHVHLEPEGSRRLAQITAEALATMMTREENLVEP